MKRRTLYLFLLLSIFTQLPAQTRSLGLSKAGTQLFRNHIYCYGFSSRAQKPIFCIYKLNAQLNTLDSLVVDLDKSGVESYLHPSSDTLHDFLTIYVQKKETKLVTVLRFNKNFERIATIENIDVARLNSIAMFENELLYAGNDVYTVKSQADSTGRQFYLNKFRLKSELSNFEYAFAWQFAFEHQYINSAHLLYANRQVVLLYVTVNDGPKAGQWILRLQAPTGKLIRGTRLGEKGEASSYEPGHFSVDTLNHRLLLAGQKFTEAQLKPLEKKLAISNAPLVSLYLIELDSIGDITLKQEFKLPVGEAKTNSKKTVSNYLFRLSRLNKNREGKIVMEADIFKNSDNTLRYQYANTTLFTLSMPEDRYVAEKSSISSNPLIEKFYFSQDKADRNGKVAVDSLMEFEKLFYTPLNFPVKQAFKTDADGNAIWLLKKSNPKKGSMSYALVSPVKKIYQLTPVEDIPTSKKPWCAAVNDTSFVIAQQAEETVYQLKVYGW